MAQTNEAVSANLARDTTPEENKAIILRYAEELWTQGRLEVADELVHPDIHSPPPAFAEPVGFDDFKMYVQKLRDAFPDGRFICEDMVAEGDKVAVRWTYEGTHAGEFMGHPPTGRKFEMKVIGIYRLKGGKIIEVHKLNVATDFLTALGFTG